MRCQICKLDKLEEEFSWENKEKGKKQSRCKQCQRIFSKSHYQRSKKKYSEAARLQRAQGKKYIKEYLEKHPCVDCGKTDIRILDFDHRDNKIFGIGGNFGHSIDKLKEEIEKCDVRCGNCHRKKTKAGCVRKKKQDAYYERVFEEKEQYIQEYLRTHPCVDCNESDYRVLEFDHVGSKKHNISYMLGSRFSLLAVMEEIKECEVRCVNCHRLRHLGS